MPTVRYTVAQGEVIAEKRGGVRSLYTPDPLGSTIALIDNTQTITDTWVYWPYGEVKTRTGTTATPFQYVGTQGYYHDSDVRAYVRARYLDKAKARWLTEDPIGLAGGINLFSYASDNPTSWIDRRGLKPRPQKGCKEKHLVEWAIDKICKLTKFPEPVPRHVPWCIRNWCSGNEEIICGSRRCVADPRLNGYVHDCGPFTPPMIILCPGNLWRRIKPQLSVEENWALVLLHEVMHWCGLNDCYIERPDNRPNPADQAAIACLGYPVEPLPSYQSKE